eukprot:COSAG03_NODE_3359_length_2062_cov_2.907794_1_plen_126_part_10
MDDGAELRDRLDSVLSFLASDCALKEGLSPAPPCTGVLTDHRAESLLTSSRSDGLQPISKSAQAQTQATGSVAADTDAHGAYDRSFVDPSALPAHRRTDEHETGNADCDSIADASQQGSDSQNSVD